MPAQTSQYFRDMVKSYIKDTKTCPFCLTTNNEMIPIDSIVDILRGYEEKISLLEHTIELQQKKLTQDSTLKYLTSQPHKDLQFMDFDCAYEFARYINGINNDLKELDIENNTQLYQPKLDMYTLTFDPKKFPQLVVQEYQYQYIQSILSEFILRFDVPFFGCVEKHRSGVLHCHFLTEKQYHLNTADQLQFLKYKFTDDNMNTKAVQCCTKKTEEAIDYILKEETKPAKSKISMPFFKYKKIFKKKYLDFVN